MMKSTSTLTIASSVTPSLSAHLLRTDEGEPKRHLRSRSLEQQPDETITCIIKAVCPMFDFDMSDNKLASSSHELVCNEPNGVLGMSYEIVGPGSHRLMEYVNQDVRLSRVSVDPLSTSFQVPDDVVIEALTRDPAHRSLEQQLPFAVGTRSVLALHVSFDDRKPSYSANDLGNALFGPETQFGISMRSQFDACSFGKLKMNPAVGNNINNGVAEIHVPALTSNVNRYDAERLARKVAKEIYGNYEHVFDHVLFCMPPGIKYSDTTYGWSAYAYLGSSLSFYNNKACLSTSAVHHEIGHNFGLGHSNYLGEYGDSTGNMGVSFDYTGWPRRCYNAEKHYLLGWYADRATEVNVIEEGPWKGTLVAFTDYDKAKNGEVVVVKINGGKDASHWTQPYYLQFNRQEGFNSETQSRQNLIVTVKGTTGYRIGYTGSEIVEPAGGAGMALDTNAQRYNPRPPHIQVIENFDRSGSDLVIEICEQEYGQNGKDFAILSIHIAGVQQSACLATSQPLLSPSVSPCSSPTPAPSSSPSESPSSPPTELPSRSPTVAPSTDQRSSPSVSPSIIPSSSPSSFPSCFPTTQVDITKNLPKLRTGGTQPSWDTVGTVLLLCSLLVFVVAGSLIAKKRCHSKTNEHN